MLRIHTSQALEEKGKVGGSGSGRQTYAPMLIDDDQVRDSNFDPSHRTRFGCTSSFVSDKDLERCTCKPGTLMVFP